VDEISSSNCLSINATAYFKTWPIESEQLKEEKAGLFSRMIAYQETQQLTSKLDCMTRVDQNKENSSKTL